MRRNPVQAVVALPELGGAGLVLAGLVGLAARQSASRRSPTANSSAVLGSGGFGSVMSNMGLHPPLIDPYFFAMLEPSPRS